MVASMICSANSCLVEAGRGKGGGGCAVWLVARAHSVLRPAPDLCTEPRPPATPPPAQENPYHNRVHATDVLQWTHVIMTRGGLLSQLQVGLGMTHAACHLQDVYGCAPACIYAHCWHAPLLPADPLLCVLLLPLKVGDAGTLAVYLAAAIHDLGHKVRVFAVVVFLVQRFQGSS